MPGLESIERLLARTADQGAAGVLVLNPVNLRYLTGYHSNAYSRPLALVLGVDGTQVMLVPRLEAAQARALTAVQDIRDYIEWTEHSRAGGAPEAEFESLLAEVLQEQHLLGKPLAVEEAALTGTRARRFAALLDAGGSIDASGWVESLRIIKSAKEVTNHQRAVGLASTGLDAALEAVARGNSEREIYAAAAHAMLTAAARDLPDEPVAVGGNAIVGKRTASLHLPETGARPRPGDLVFVVLVAAVGGSWCELSRTVVAAATPNADQRRAFRAVARAAAAARDTLRPGIAACEVDRVARQTIAAEGFADAQPMRTGHGLGISGGSEAPQLGAADTTPLAAGMVVSIEPSICVPGFGGVCWADNFAITDDGARRLSDYPVLDVGQAQEVSIR
jgi:Xaa-Pro aminopeptidase